MSRPAESKYEWPICAVCTFHNHPLMVRCEMCGTAAPSQAKGGRKEEKVRTAQTGKPALNRADLGPSCQQRPRKSSAPGKSLSKPTAPPKAIGLDAAQILPQRELADDGILSGDGDGLSASVPLAARGKSFGIGCCGACGEADVRLCKEEGTSSWYCETCWDEYERITDLLGQGAANPGPPKPPAPPTVLQASAAEAKLEAVDESEAMAAAAAAAASSVVDGWVKLEMTLALCALRGVSNALEAQPAELEHATPAPVGDVGNDDDWDLVSETSEAVTEYSIVNTECTEPFSEPETREAWETDSLVRTDETERQPCLEPVTEGEVTTTWATRARLASTRTSPPSAAPRTMRAAVARRKPVQTTRSKATPRREQLPRWNEVAFINH